MFERLKKWLVKSPADSKHVDGFVYKVALEYKLVRGTKHSYIQITDDGNIIPVKIALPHKNETFTIQFGGEANTPPVFASIKFTEKEIIPDANSDT